MTVLGRLERVVRYSWEYYLITSRVYWVCIFFRSQVLQGQSMAPRLPMVLQDARLLLMRLAYQESLSADCGGGAARSNIQLIPYHIQVWYFLSTTFSFFSI